MPNEICSVCRARALHPFMVVEEIAYLRCSACHATLVAPEHFVTSRDEHRHYLQHENDVDDPAYRKFVSKLVEPLARRLRPGAEGLDYGCGPGPVAATMLHERGFKVELFDPFFAPDEAVLRGSYDFIICSEVVEHFHRPADEFDKLASLLRPAGVLGIMTCFQTNDETFAKWHYPRDPTHVVFYREETLRRVAAERAWTCEFPTKDVALMVAPARG